MNTPVWSMIVVVFACMIGSFGALLLKQASAVLSFNIKKIITNGKLVLGVALYGVSTVIFIPALKAGELSVLYPIVSTTYIWTTLLSLKYLKEKMNFRKWSGITLILIGVAFIGFGS